MKKLLQFVLFSTILIASKNVTAQITATNNFQNLTVADGLVNDDVTDIFIQNDSNVWIATSGGLSHYNGSGFINYTVANSGLNDDDIAELEFCQNKLWMVSGGGISSFDGTSFTNYTVANGLISANILGLAATGSDTLWMTSTAGTGKFDGANFTNYSSQSGRDIETDSSDRVYVMRATVANNFPFARLYENGVWSMPAQAGITSGIIGAKLIKTASNNLYVAGLAGNPTIFFKINYPLNCVQQNVYSNNSLHSNLGNIAINPQQFEELNGNRWMGAGTNVPFYNASADSNYISQYIRNSSAVSSCIKAQNNVLIIGSDSGLFLTLPTLKSNRSSIGHEFAVNKIRTSVTLTDPLFSDLSGNRSNFEFPKDSNTHAIYSANFIVAAKKSNQSNFLVHPINGYTQAFNPGPITNSGGVSKNYLVRVYRQDILNHITNFNQIGYALPDGIRNWPAAEDSIFIVSKDLAPFFDANSNGCYDPQNGDYPIIKGDEALYWINHPTNQNLELEYHWMMYGFNGSSIALDQTIFVQYTIINRAAVAYDSIKTGFYIDGDLGDPTDDYVGSDSLNNLLYFYNGTSFDIGSGGMSGYGSNTPSLGVKFLSDSMENSFYYSVGSGVTGDPINAQDWLNYMSSTWKNGQPMTYGGDGFSTNTSNNPTRYIFTGDPVTSSGWTEKTARVGRVSNASGDRRLLGSVPYFTLQPNERKTIEIAVGFGRTTSTSQVVGKNVNEMKSVLNQVESFWDTLSSPVMSFVTTDTCNVLTSVQDLIAEKSNSLSIFPVPSSGELTVETEENMVLMEVYDMKGSQILSLPVNQKQTHISLAGYQNGFYLIRVQLQDETWMMKKVVKR